MQPKGFRPKFSQAVSITAKPNDDIWYEPLELVFYLLELVRYLRGNDVQGWMILGFILIIFIDQSGWKFADRPQPPIQ